MTLLSEGSILGDPAAAQETPRKTLPWLTAYSDAI
jgi:hypothetical protein